MVFSTPIFLFVFLPLTVLAFYAVNRRLGHEAGLIFLLLASLVFYGWWDVRFMPLILGSIVVNYALARVIRPGNGGWLLAFGVALNLGALAVFKYADFFVRNVNALTGLELSEPGLPLPLAISFFTFQQIAFLVDCSRRITAPDGKPHRYSLFVAFFPQLIAGPIVHHRLMSPQLGEKSRQSDISANLGIGLSIFAVGLAKKVLLADNLAPYANAAFDTAAAGEPVGLWLAWTGALAYTLQIYFDFSGYSDMAMGIARMFGFQLPVNFNAPYKARNITDFWRRWHITLSQFLRDYLYVSLGGNRKGYARMLANLMIVMLLGGLWHGAAWTFVVWGGLHGAALIWCRLLDRWLPNGLFGRFWIASSACTFLFVIITWVFFRATSFDAAAIMLQGMAGLNGLGVNPGDGPFIAAIIGLILIWSLPETAQIFYRQIEDGVLKTANVAPPRKERWKPNARWGIGLAVLLFACMIASWSYSEFIYYNF
ncbi:membrane bound O-acyl transferase, MBOAT family protein [Glycocaulis alkaliphilus]|uniref:Probable alginate O-acetylase AlgI n=1 Tax=Glycocaulis alkaliphilus TaxID=1434191 RepID=A0A3T0EB62_9PROT|nr:MBOAT family protein [Glycocaulis alkaliphilus]AZU04661.1 membrane bound O-acyl transferase, MBOAT family protein [Glycocaulis alkaliphilus]GGB68730.1 alginate O-acetylation protein [Glycocaulis alkaliphilus]